MQGLQQQVIRLQAEGGGGGGGGQPQVQIQYVQVPVPMPVPGGVEGSEGAAAPHAAPVAAVAAAVVAAPSDAPASAPSTAALGVEASPQMGPTHPKSERDVPVLESSFRASEVDEVRCLLPSACYLAHQTARCWGIIPMHPCTLAPFPALLAVMLATPLFAL